MIYTASIVIINDTFFETEHVWEGTIAENGGLEAYLKRYGKDS
jgi:hypothetical protein